MAVGKWTGRIEKVETNFSFTICQYVLNTWKRRLLYWVLLYLFSILRTPIHLVTQFFIKWLASWNGWLILLRCMFFFFHPVYRSGIQLFNNHNPENREPSFNYLVMFSGTVGHFDKNRTLVKLTNCEKNCHISHILFSKHLL